MGRAGGGSRPSHRSTSSHSFSHSRSTSSHSFSRSSGRSSSSSFHSGGRGRSGSSYSSSRIPVHTPVYVPPVRTHTTVYRDRTVYAPGTTSERTEYGGSVSTRDDGLNAKFWRTVLLFGFFFLLLFCRNLWYILTKDIFLSNGFILQIVQQRRRNAHEAGQE